MSATTRWSRAERAGRGAGGPDRRPRSARSLATGLLALAAGLFALTLPSAAPAHHAAVAAPPLPAAAAAQAPGLAPQGGGEMRVLGFLVYDGWYWATGHDWTLEKPYALDLVYHRKLSGASIAERSVQEIARLGVAGPDELARWGELMRGIFPDVVAGDRLTGLSLPSGTVRFFGNGKPIGEIADPAFARAFFGIWLDPKTSRADYRARLLGRQ